MTFDESVRPDDSAPTHRRERRQCPACFQWFDARAGLDGWIYPSHICWAADPRHANDPDPKLRVGSTEEGPTP